MEVTWEFIVQSEKGFGYKRIFHDYDLYVIKDNYEGIELANILGSRYFLFDLCIDEIVELFNEMALSKYSNNMTDFYAFIMFFFKKSLFNKQVEREVADDIYNKYFKENEFIIDMISYKDTESDFVYSTFLRLLEDLKYSW